MTIKNTQAAGAAHHLLELPLPFGTSYDGNSLRVHLRELYQPKHVEGNKLIIKIPSLPFGSKRLTISFKVGLDVDPCASVQNGVQHTIPQCLGSWRSGL